MAKFQDDKIKTIKNDIERVRARASMYISYLGERGALHLVKEVVNNAVDEASSDKSPCDTIDIIFNEKDNQVTVIDNGRGIPFDKVSEVCTILHSGSNLTKANETEFVSQKAGENGVGLTAVNALSEHLTFIIYREGKKGTFQFADVDGKDDEGKPAKVRKLVSEVYEDDPSNQHGTAVIFKPSETWLGKCNIDEKALYDWVDMISYFTDPKLSINYTYIKKGKEVPKSKRLFHKNGPLDLLNIDLQEPVLSDTQIFKSDIPNLLFLFNYDEKDSTDFTHVKSFCNWVNTIDHGVHVNAFKAGFCTAISRIIPNYMTETEKKKYPITYEDIRQGLHAIIFTFVNKPLFTGQTKEKVGNEEIFGPIKDMVFESIFEYLTANPGEAKKICNYVKKNAKARLEVSKIRKSDYKRLDTFEEATLNGYSPASGNGYKELFIVEGDSAKGHVVGFRDPSSQAVFKIKGNPKNSYGVTVSKILENDELKTLTRIIGAGIGKDFNIKKCNFDKIIILVDSDIDGYNMTSLLCTFFLTFMPEIVEQGRLYKALAPLYVLKDASNPYILSKVDYYRLFAKNVVKQVTLVDEKGHELTDKELSQLIEANQDYLSELEPLAQYIFCNPQLIEHLLLHKDTPKSKLNTMLRKKFPELSFDESSDYITGAIDGVYQDLLLDKSFYSRATRLIHLIHDVNHSNIYYTMKVGDKTIPVSIGSFFDYVKRYMPVVDKRIKGLGELKGEILWETTLNPKKRTLTQFTLDSLDVELGVVKILHGDKPELRKDFMLENESKFNRDILDN